MLRSFGSAHQAHCCGVRVACDAQAGLDDKDHDYVWISPDETVQVRGTHWSHLTPPGATVSQATVEQPTAHCTAACPGAPAQIPFSRAWEDMLEVASRYDLAVSGDALAYCERAGVAAALIPLVQVFARVSPEQKELVVVTLRAKGRVTLMCGDGTNDVGGLKAAHVGVALLSASEAAVRPGGEGPYAGIEWN